MPLKGAVFRIDPASLLQVRLVSRKKTWLKWLLSTRGCLCPPPWTSPSRSRTRPPHQHRRPRLPRRAPRTTCSWRANTPTPSCMASTVCGSTTPSATWRSAAAARSSPAIASSWPPSALTFRWGQALTLPNGKSFPIRLHVTSNLLIGNVLHRLDWVQIGASRHQWCGASDDWHAGELRLHIRGVHFQSQCAGKGPDPAPSVSCIPCSADLLGLKCSALTWPQALLAAANLLDVMAVREACCRFMECQMDETNCVGIHCFAEAHSCKVLEKRSMDYILEHFGSVYQQVC